MQFDARGEHMAQSDFSHFTIHIFFTICEALFHAMAYIIPSVSIFPYCRAENINFVFLLLRHCQSAGLFRHCL